MALTNKASISSLLGYDDFNSSINKVKRLEIKMIIDSLCRISSSRANRKYRNGLLRYLNSKSKLQLYIDTDGKRIEYEDNTILNYRKIEALENFINEIKTNIKKFGINELHLDNCQIWTHNTLSTSYLPTLKIFIINNIFHQIIAIINLVIYCLVNIIIQSQRKNGHLRSPKRLKILQASFLVQYHY